jgi:polysaccharide export outer membrane protein
VDHRAYPLSKGDKLRLVIYGEADLSGEFLIDSAGELAMPFIGRIKAVGKRVPELERDLVDAYSDGWLVNPSISVELLTYRRVFVWGEVRAPGAFPYEEGLTVLRAVSLAGGLTEYGDDRRVTLYRGGAGQAQEVRYDTPLGVGDFVRVPED